MKLAKILKAIIIKEHRQWLLLASHALGCGKDYSLLLLQFLLIQVSFLKR